MPIHFTYKDGPFPTDLCQGDILARTPAIEALLEAYYPRYAANKENKYFLVLTQSCDLVRRGGAPCDAPYISLAPARPISVALSRKLNELIEGGLPVAPPVCTHRNRSRLEMWMARLLNNNESAYFFLRKSPERDVAEDCCAFLALSIAIKSDLHYGTCLEARRIALADAFQAKLGWLVGQMYSRIGTEDWDEADVQRETKLALKRLAIWVDDKKLKPLTQLVAEWQAANPEGVVDGPVIEGLLKRVPKQKDQVVTRIMELLHTKGLVPPGQEVQTRNLITNDPTLASLLKD